MILSDVISFTSWREVSLAEPTLSDSKWHFRMEERYDPGVTELVSFSDPFELSVTRSGLVEQFHGCTWTSQKRQMGMAAMLHIREAVANSYTVSSE